MNEKRAMESSGAGLEGEEGELCRSENWNMQVGNDLDL